MNNQCVVCNKRLNFLNKPMFGVGKLKDKSQICFSCFKEISNHGPKISKKLKNYSAEELKQYIKKDKHPYPESVEFSFEVESSSDKGSSRNDENEIYTKKYNKWHSEHNTVGKCYRKKRINPLVNGKEEKAYYKSDRYAVLFGRGKDCSYFPGYGKIFNRKFELWFQEVGSNEKQNIAEYNDIGCENQPPFFIEKTTRGVLINNQLERTKGFIKLFNGKDIKNRRTWYAGLKEIEFTGIITDREKE